MLCVFLCLLVANCGGGGGGIGIGITGITSGTDDAGTSGSSAAASTAEAASETETSLYSDGPIDLPVTIAKLETPDVTKLLISAQSLDQSINAPQNLRTLLNRYSTTDPTVAYAIVGSAGAVHDPDVTPFVFLENATNDTTEFCDVSLDGSFTCAILGDLNDDLRLYASTADDISTAQMSPPLYIRLNELGTTTIGDTNSTNISADFKLMTDNVGNYYLVIITDGRSTFARRSITGTTLEVIWDTNDDESSIIPTVIESLDSESLLLFDKNGDFYEVSIESTSSASVASSFLTGSKPAYSTITPTITAVSEINDNLIQSDPSTTPGYRIQVIYDSGTSSDATGVAIFYPQSVSTDQTVGRIFNMGTSGGTKQIGDVTYEMSTYGFQSIQPAFASSFIGLATITDPDIAGCETKCRGEYFINSTEGEYGGVLSILDGSEFPDNVQQMLASPFDYNYYYFITPGGTYQYGSDGNYRRKISDENNPISLTLSEKGTLIAGCCVDSNGNNSICLYNEAENDFDIVWQEDGDLCDANSPPEINPDNNDVHFYDSLGQHRGLYESTNAAAYSTYYTHPPLFLGRCGYTNDESLTQDKWADFCYCWGGSGGDYGAQNFPLSTSTCSSYYNECVSTGHSGDMSECYFYVNNNYVCSNWSTSTHNAYVHACVFDENGDYVGSDGFGN